MAGKTIPEEAADFDSTSKDHVQYRFILAHSMDRHVDRELVFGGLKLGVEGISAFNGIGVLAGAGKSVEQNVGVHRCAHGIVSWFGLYYSVKHKRMKCLRMI